MPQNEPPHEKTNKVVSEHAWHKQKQKVARIQKVEELYYPCSEKQKC